MDMRDIVLTHGMEWLRSLATHDIFSRLCECFMQVQWAQSLVLLTPAVNRTSRRVMSCFPLMQGSNSRRPEMTAGQGSALRFGEVAREKRQGPLRCADEGLRESAIHSNATTTVITRHIRDDNGHTLRTQLDLLQRSPRHRA